MRRLTSVLIVTGTVLAVAQAVVTPSYAATVLRISVREMLNQSDLVFEGHVTRVESRMDPQATLIHTYVTFQIFDVIKGAWPDQTIELSFLGGTADGRTLVVPGMQIPELGEQGIYFVESLARNQVHPLYGWTQGHLRLSRSKGGALNVLTSQGVPVIGIDHTQKGRSGEISRGVAVGLLIDPDAPEEDAMRAEDVKEILRSWLERSP